MKLLHNRRELLHFGLAAGTAASLAPLAVWTSAAHAQAAAAAPGAPLASVQALQLSTAEIADTKARKLRFGFLTNNVADDFSKTLVAGGKKYADDYGIELVINSADFDANKQLAQFNALLQQKVSGIFLTAVNADTIGAALVRANQANIPVFVVGGAPARGTVASVMNASSYQGCLDAGTALMQRINKPNATIAVLGIPFALQTIRDREKGIIDAIGRAGGQMVSLQSDFNQDKLLSLATNVIQAQPNLDGIFATWSLAVNAVTEAVKQSKKNIPFAGYDAEAAGYKEFAAGNKNLVALSGQQAFLQGRAAIEGLVRVIMGQTLAKEIITPNLLVTTENHAAQWAVQYPGSPKPF